MVAYIPVLIHLIFSVIIGVMALTLGYLLAKQRPNIEKNAPYECGFPSFFRADVNFYIPFYRVAILFILFDIETVFFIPWALSLKQTGKIGWLAMFIFFLFLIIGILYEWRKGMLQWK